MKHGDLFLLRKQVQYKSNESNIYRIMAYSSLTTIEILRLEKRVQEIRIVSIAPTHHGLLNSVIDGSLSGTRSTETKYIRNR